MKSIKNKLLVCLFAICIIMTSAIGVFAAGNTTDKTFKLSLSPGSGTDYKMTEWREKRNKSAVYFKVNYVKYEDNDLTGWVQGKSGTVVSNCSGGHYYTVNVVKTFKMSNYVREEGNDYARVKVGADATDKNRIEGVWSPDSKK